MLSVLCTYYEKTISIVIPFYNEEGNVEELYRQLKSFLLVCAFIPIVISLSTL